jgi:uncharacterized protein (TIGR03000 family)
MTDKWLAAGALGIVGMMLCPAVSSAQMRVNSPNVTGFYSGANYSPYRSGGYGPGYYGRPFNSGSYYPSYYNNPYYHGESYLTAPQIANYYEPSILASANAALVDVRVPTTAEVWFEGDKTSQTGSDRSFVSPQLQPGKSFTYDIRARWTGPDGKVVDQTRQVPVRANERSTVDFLPR